MRPRIYANSLLNVWVSTVGIAAFAMIFVVGGVILVTDLPPGSPLEWCIYGLVLTMVVDVMVATGIKVATGAERRRAISRAWDAYDRKDYSRVVEELAPHTKDLSYVDKFRYLRAKDLLQRSRSQQVEKRDLDL